MFTLRRLFRLHRSIGLAAALFFLFLAGSGLLLNHTDTLRLDERHLAWPWLLAWYGIRAPEPVAFPVDGHWVIQMGERIYFDSRELPLEGPLKGGVVLPRVIAVAAGGKLLLLTHGGEVVEFLEGAPEGIKRLGRLKGRLAVEAAGGLYVADEDLLAWEPLSSPEGILWAHPSPLPREMRRAVEHAYLGKGLTLERFLLDLHSGRVLGTLGVILVDLAALALFALVATGLWMWLRLHRKR
ncbi:MAG: hypothetical protein D6819_04355 [Gammaproteobacteria bacterium]|nr:MAG: hypothetical protein D6819_04355 [Gammaproteobacteria bacterium]